MTTFDTMPNHKIHEGRNVKRFWEMLGMKQDALAADLGDDWNQQKISLLEQKNHRPYPAATNCYYFKNTCRSYSEF